MFRRTKQFIAESGPFFVLPIVLPHTLSTDVLKSLFRLFSSLPSTEFEPFPLELQVKFSLGPTNLPPICPCFHSSCMHQPCSGFFSFSVSPPLLSLSLFFFLPPPHSSLTLFEEILLLNLSESHRLRLLYNFGESSSNSTSVLTLQMAPFDFRCNNFNIRNYLCIYCLPLTYDLQRLRTSFATFAAGKVYGTAIHPQSSPKQTRLKDGGSELNNTDN